MIGLFLKRNLKSFIILAATFSILKGQMKCDVKFFTLINEIQINELKYTYFTII